MMKIGKAVTDHSKEFRTKLVNKAGKKKITQNTPGKIQKAK